MLKDPSNSYICHTLLSKHASIYLDSIERMISIDCISVRITIRIFSFFANFFPILATNDIFCSTSSVYQNEYGGQSYTIDFCFVTLYRLHFIFFFFHSIAKQKSHEFVTGGEILFFNPLRRPRAHNRPRLGLASYTAHDSEGRDCEVLSAAPNRFTSWAIYDVTRVFIDPKYANRRKTL